MIATYGVASRPTPVAALMEGRRAFLWSNRGITVPARAATITSSSPPFRWSAEQKSVADPGLVQFDSIATSAGSTLHLEPRRGDYIHTQRATRQGASSGPSWEPPPMDR